MKVVWDLDGVLRDINGHIMKLYGGGYPDKWEFLNGSGKNVVDTINANMDILIESPPTAYLHVLKKHYPYPEIWTAQPPEWRENTLKWIQVHIGHCEIRFLRPSEKQKELKKIGDTIIIEDSPNFKSYENVLLIDRPYNQEVEHVARIYGTKHLNNVLELMKES